MKQFEIQYNGGKEQVEIADNPPTEVVLKILQLIKFGARGNIEYDIREYIMLVATNVVTKAPWKLQSPDAIKNLPLETFEELWNHIADEYPAERFLSLLGKTVFGKKFATVDFQSVTESSMNAPSLDSPPSK